ncbi:DUF3558 domain-containing protein [Saccharothrix sp. Mg75]|uniref:DUF3558 domain-containing protein n=1 Tax=Saccharothrix sp. Mg75 TaxID=3445357 RepID=UPI003EEACE8A
MTSRTLIAGLAVALSTVAACGGPVNGEPRPARTATSTADAPASLKDVEPCDLLTRDEAERLFGPLREAPAREDLGTARGCTFKPKLTNLGIDVRTNAGLADVQPTGEISDVAVGGRDAKQVTAPGGTCTVAIEVTGSSRVDVSYTGDPSEDTCAPARRVAELVEPRLP